MKAQKSALRIIGSVVPNERCRTWDVNVSLSNSYIESFHFPLADYEKKKLENIGPVGKELIEKLADLPGIDHVTLQRYRLQAIIAEAFDWEGIEENVVAALREAFGERASEVSVTKQDIRSRYRNSGTD